MKWPVGVEKVTVISDQNGSRSMVIRRRNVCHAVDHHSRRPADHDGLKFVREQFFLAAAAQNIKRLMRFLSQPTTPTVEATT